jgi:hypothetical protein
MKERGQKRAVEKAGPAWCEKALTLLAQFIAQRQGAPFKFEDFRKHAVGRIAAPPSPNVWGALPRLAVKRGLIEFTGRYENAESPATRSHPVKCWRGRPA